MLLSNDAWIQNAGTAGQGIDSGINTALYDLAAEVGRRVEVRKSGCRGRVGVVVGRYINGLHGSDRTGFRGSNALLQFADFGVQVGLVTNGGRHAAKQRGNFRTGLNEAENVVDEQEYVKMLLIAEIFRDSQTRQAHAETRSGWFGHLSVNQRRARLLRMPRHNHSRLLEFLIQVVALARPFSHAGEHRHAAVLQGDVVNQLLNQNRFAYTSAAEQSDFSSLQKGLDQVDDLNTGFKHFERCCLFIQGWRGSMNRVVRI